MLLRILQAFMAEDSSGNSIRYSELLSCVIGRSVEKSVSKVSGSRPSWVTMSFLRGTFKFNWKANSLGSNSSPARDALWTNCSNVALYSMTDSRH